MAAATNPKFQEAIDAIAKDPSAFMRYKDDKEVMKYLSKMMGVFGQQFEESQSGGSQ